MGCYCLGEDKFLACKINIYTYPLSQARNLSSLDINDCLFIIAIFEIKTKRTLHGLSKVLDIFI